MRNDLVIPRQRNDLANMARFAVHMSKGPPCTVAQAAVALDMEYSTLQKWGNALNKAGLIEVCGFGERTQWGNKPTNRGKVPFLWKWKGH